MYPQNRVVLRRDCTVLKQEFYRLDDLPDTTDVT